MNIKNLEEETKNILKIIKKIKTTKFNYYFIINEIILINLKIENILFEKNNKKGSPARISLQLLKISSELVNLKNHDKNI